MGITAGVYLNASKKGRKKTKKLRKYCNSILFKERISRKKSREI